MKAYSVLSVTLACVLAAAIVNADNVRPSDWGGGPNAYDVALDSETKLSGRSSVRLSRTDAASKHRFGTVVQAIDASRFAGQRLRYAGYIKTEDVSEYAGLWMRIDSRERGTIAFDNMQRRPITGTNDWRRYEIVLDVSSDGAMIHFGALLAGGGVIWIDDLSLDVVSDETETTTDAIRPTNQEIKIPSKLSNVPKNLSFES